MRVRLNPLYVVPDVFDVVSHLRVSTLSITLGQNLEPLLVNFLAIYFERANEAFPPQSANDGSCILRSFLDCCGHVLSRYSLDAQSVYLGLNRPWFQQAFLHLLKFVLIEYQEYSFDIVNRLFYFDKRDVAQALKPPTDLDLLQVPERVGQFPFLFVASS